MSASILQNLVRNFPENGPKLLCENPANVRDLLAIVREPAVDAIDFAAMTVERTHFVKPDYAHVALDLLLKAPFRVGNTAETIFIYVLMEHQSKPQRFFQLRLAEYVLEAYKMQKRAWDAQQESDAGGMSLVGPRPFFEEDLSNYEPHHFSRLAVKPGLTGLWQVRGRSRTTFDEMVRLDLRYAKTRSLWTDLKILVATPMAVIAGKGAR